VGTVAKRGTCSICDREMRLTVRGKIWPHGAKARGVWPPIQCPGSNLDPKDGDDGTAGVLAVIL